MKRVMQIYSEVGGVQMMYVYEGCEVLLPTNIGYQKNKNNKYLNGKICGSKYILILRTLLF